MENNNPKKETIFTKITSMLSSPDKNLSISSTKSDGSNKISDLVSSQTYSLASLESASVKSTFTSWWVVALVILILAFLGFNIFIYLAKGTQGIIDFFSPILKIIGYNAEVGTKKVINVSAKGLQNVSSSIAKATSTSTGPSPNPNIPVNNTPTTRHGADYSSDDTDKNIDDSLSQSINASPTTSSSSSSYTPDESSSIVQSSNMTNKSGWCYIGEEKGFRSCIGVGPSDKCMSGDIFPTQDVCMNPNLRP